MHRFPQIVREEFNMTLITRKCPRELLKIFSECMRQMVGTADTSTKTAFTLPTAEKK